jgi:hypothetical protein
MNLVSLLLLGAAFATFTALVFSVLTLLLGKVYPAFEISGPDNWSFIDFYKRYLIIAVVYVFVSLPLGNGLLGIGALAVAYKYVFDAGWTQAIVMGIVGGLIALMLFVLLLWAVLTPLGLL